MQAFSSTSALILRRRSVQVIANQEVRTENTRRTHENHMLNIWEMEMEMEIQMKFQSQLCLLNLQK